MTWKQGFRWAVLGLFFFTLIWFAFSSGGFVNSPDENAAMVFTTTFAEHGELSVESAFDEPWNVLVHPRSTLVLAGRIVPVSFLGLPTLAGVVVRVFGDSGMLFVTPLLAVLAIIAWHRLILQVFHSQRLADFAALFLLIHPAFWHYSGRVMMHNVGFISLLIIGAWIFICQPFARYWQRAWWLNDVFSGFAIGLALIFRSSEMLWVACIIIGLCLWKGRAIGWKRLGCFVLGGIFALLPFLFLHQNVYGAPWLTGYTAKPKVLTISQEQIDVIVDSQEGQASLPGFLGMLFPFGIHEMNILQNILHYGFLLYPWLSGLSFIGMLFAWKKRLYRPWLVITIGLGAWLGVVYGSWAFSDNPDASVITIANSYTRYWLPLFVLGSLFAAYTTHQCGVWIKRYSGLIATIFPWTVASIAIFLSAQMVLFGTDGFVHTLANLQRFEEKKQMILEKTDEDDLVIVDMADKYIFPDRHVVTPLRNPFVYAYLPEMISTTDVYYFGITLPSEDIEHLETVILVDSGIQIEPIANVDDETLYKFFKP